MTELPSSFSATVFFSDSSSNTSLLDLVIEINPVVASNPWIPFLEPSDDLMSLLLFFSQQFFLHLFTLEQDLCFSLEGV